MIIVIASAKGGSGKTTTAMHLAEFLSRKRGSGKVVLLDADPDNESASHWYKRGEDWRFSLVSIDKQVPSDFDTLIVDSGAAPGDDELSELMESASLLLIPTAPSVMDLESAVKTASQFDLSGNDIKLLLTLCPPGRAKAGPDALDTLQQYNMPVCPKLVRRRGCLATAAEEGTTVATLKGDAAQKSWVEYQAAFRWLLKGVA